MSQATAKFVKAESVNSRLGLVLGWGMIEKQDGVDYYDTQGDHIPGDAQVEAGMEFMLNSRVSGDMHKSEDGDVVFWFPLTEEIAKAFDITTTTTGTLVAIKPSEEVFGKFESGEYTGFSIGGARLEEEVVEA